MFVFVYLQLKDLVRLVAWKSGYPSFQVVAECVENGFSELTQSFIKNTLVTEAQLQVTSVTCRKTLTTFVFFILVIFIYLLHKQFVKDHYIKSIQQAPNLNS